MAKSSHSGEQHLCCFSVSCYSFNLLKHTVMLMSNSISASLYVKIHVPPNMQLLHNIIHVRVINKKAYKIERIFLTANVVTLLWFIQPY